MTDATTTPDLLDDAIYHLQHAFNNDDPTAYMENALESLEKMKKLAERTTPICEVEIDGDRDTFCINMAVRDSLDGKGKIPLYFHSDPSLLTTEPPKDMRMDAYYYGFRRTGVAEIDLILSAVACAGKDFHHTGQWCEKFSDWNGENTYPYHAGNSCVERIQNAADNAAKACLHPAARKQIVIDTCDLGHKFAKLPDHPTKDGRPRCPYCMAIGIDARREMKQQEKHSD